jgi:hypothetical protein
MYDTLVRPVISVSGMPENATNAINHVFHEKEKEITDYLESKGILYRALDVQRDNFVAEQRDLDQVQKIFLSGASIQCFAHSKCVLAPAGDLELLNQSNPLEKQIGDLSGRLDTEFSTAFNYLVLKGVVKKDERASLSKLLLDDPGAFLKKVEGKLGHQQVHTLPAIIGELSKLHAQYKEIILIQRERSAIKKLHAHAQADTSEQRIFPLVYGSGHNFTQAVNETNKKLNPEYRYGLITMKYNGTAVPTLELKQK